MHYEKLADGSVKCIEEEIPFELPDGWSWARLGSIANIVTGRLDANAQTPDGEYPFFTCGEEVFKTDTYAFDCNAILLGGNNATGDFKMHKFSGKFNAYQRVYVITTFPEIDVDYLYNHIRFYLPKLQSQSIGSQTRYLKLGMITDLLVALPTFREQKLVSSSCNKYLNYCTEIASEKDDLKKYIKSAKSKILDLAIRGQLVPQNPDDEPATVLLERIRAEKEELIKQGKIKRDKKESIIFRGEDNSYYQQTGILVENLDDWDLEDIPDTWELCCLGELCDYGNCINVDTKNITDDAWILDLEDIEKDSGRVLQKIRKFERESSSTKHVFHKGQVLYSKLRPYLNKVVIADEDGFCTSEILPLNFSDIVEPQYALYYLMSPTFLKYANRCSYGVKMPRLGTADGKKAAFPLPPLDEQKRIVQQVSSILVKMDIISNALL